jgi:hypothetical protein
MAKSVAARQIARGVSFEFHAAATPVIVLGSGELIEIAARNVLEEIDLSPAEHYNPGRRQSRHAIQHRCGMQQFMTQTRTHYDAEFAGIVRALVEPGGQSGYPGGRAAIAQ